MTTPEKNRTAHGRRVLAIVAAVVAALLIWLVATPMAGLDLTVHSAGPDAAIGPVAVATATVAAGVVAWALLAVLERLIARPRRAWFINSTVALVVSLAGPILDATTVPVALVLVGMHLTVGVVLMWLLGGTAPVPSPRRRTVTA